MINPFDQTGNKIKRFTTGIGLPDTGYGHCLLLAGVSLEFYDTRRGIRLSADSREYSAAELTGAFLSVKPEIVMADPLPQATGSNLP